MNEENRYEELQALKKDILSSLHCALPGTVVSFDAETQTAVIQPAVKRRTEQRAFRSRRQWRMKADETLTRSARSVSGRNHRTVPDVPDDDGHL